MIVVEQQIPEENIVEKILLSQNEKQQLQAQSITKLDQ